MTDLVGKAVKYAIYALVFYNIFIRVTDRSVNFNLPVTEMTEFTKIGDFLHKNGTVANSGYSK